jgi:peptidoglycan hydrolase FlgJ
MMPANEANRPMAINPASDLLSDALLAADPQRAKAAADRLASLAADDGSVPPFEEALPSQPSLTQPVTKLSIADAVHGGRAATGKQDNPYQRFEAAMLKSFFEMMLPENADSVFGTGFAGEVWKSMLAESLAIAASHAKITRIAHDLEKRARAQNPRGT